MSKNRLRSAITLSLLVTLIGYFGDADPPFGDIDHPLQVKVQRTRSTDNITVFFLNFHNLKIQFCKKYAQACPISRQPR